MAHVVLADSRSPPPQQGTVLAPRMYLHRLVLSSIAAIVSTVVVKAVSIDINNLDPESISIKFGSENFKDTNLHYVKNSGVCETTPGVTQYSGYVEVAKNMSMVSSFVVA